MGVGRASREIHRRLCSAMLFAAGTVSPSLRADDDAARSVIPVQWWAKTGIEDYQEDFWASAGITFHLDAAETSRGEPMTYEFFGIRFEPEDLQRLADDAGADVVFSARRRLASLLALGSGAEAGKAKSPPRQANRVEDESLRAWYIGYFKLFPDHVHRLVKAAYEREFPNSQVGRNQLYRVMSDVQGSLKRGNPAIYRTPAGN